MIIAVDFDGTCVTHEYPYIGRDIGAVPKLKQIVAGGHKLILWTMRSGKKLAAAKQWFDKHGIPLFGVNENPEQLAWTDSPKAYAQLYIDDAAFGAPLVFGANSQNPLERPYFDWSAFYPEKL